MCLGARPIAVPALFLVARGGILPRTQSRLIMTKPLTAPLTDHIIVALSQLVDDAQVVRRDPSHSDLEALFRRHGVSAGDPASQGQTVGKAKRVRSTFSWALEHRPEAGAEAAYGLVSTVRGHGGFRVAS